MSANGLQKFSLLDYPGQISCVLFFGRCNFRCPFCHNPSLVFDPESQGLISLSDFECFLQSRRGKLDGVVFSGGEPALQPDLSAWARAVKSHGMKLKLDTNGSFPEVVKQLFEEGVLDSLGVDLKAPASGYAKVCANPDPALPGRVRQTLRFAVKKGIALEVRTTVHKALLPPEALREMYGQLLEDGIREWVLQPFRKAELIDDTLNTIPSYSRTELENVAASLSPLIRLR